jgi:hypothetical protein
MIGNEESKVCGGGGGGGRTSVDAHSGRQSAVTGDKVTEHFDQRTREKR